MVTEPWKLTKDLSHFFPLEVDFCYTIFFASGLKVIALVFIDRFYPRLQRHWGKTELRTFVGADGAPSIVPVARYSAHTYICCAGGEMCRKSCTLYDLCMWVWYRNIQTVVFVLKKFCGYKIACGMANPIKHRLTL